MAVIVPLPLVLAVNVTGLPGLGEKVPSAGETDQLGETETEFPYPSRPAALTRVSAHGNPGIQVAYAAGAELAGGVAPAPSGRQHRAGRCRAAGTG